MANKNGIATTTQQRSIANSKPTFSMFMDRDDVKSLVQSAVGKNSQRFAASIISAVSTNPALQECRQSSILSAALLGESLNLSPSPQLGQYYLVPFKDKERGTVAQFILGYKGYIQLAIRSGQYKKLNVLAIKKGEMIRYDALNEEMFVNLIQDEEVRENTETVGYYAMFEYVNGFRKSIYWSKSKMENHAIKYSKGYQAKKGYTFWEKDFDSMAMKTMLRQLISKWGIMSIDMQTAFFADNGIIKENGEPEFVDTMEFDEDGVVKTSVESVDENAQIDPTDIETTPPESEDFDFFKTQGTN